VTSHLNTFPSHPVASSSTLTVCVASPSLHDGSLTQACRIFCIPPACVPIAPPCAGNCCSCALRSCQYYSVGGPLFSRSCHYLIPCPLVPPVWERARSVAVGSASSPLSGDVTPYTFPSHPVASSSTLTVCVASPSVHVGSLTHACRILRIPPACVPIAPPCVGKGCSRALRSCQCYSVGGPLFSRSCHCLTPCPLVPPVWERARSVAVGSASSPLSGDVTLHPFPSHPVTTSSRPRWFRVSRTVLAPLLTCGECFVATFQGSHSIPSRFVVVQHTSARTVCCACCSKLTLPHVCYVTTADNV